MPSKSSKPKQASRANENSSLLYDEALPEPLKYNGIFDDADAAIRIRTEATTISPYIIHLAKEETKTEARQTTSANIEALAQSLIIDDPEDELLTELEDESGLEVNFEDLLHQIAEQDEIYISNITLPDTTSSTNIPAPDEPANTPVSLLSRNEIREHLRVEEKEKPSAEAVKITVESTEIPEVVVVEAIEEPVIKAEVPQHQETEPEDTPKRLHVLTFLSPRLRAVAAFAFLAFAIVLPLQAIQGVSSAQSTQTQITSVGQQAISHFLRGTKSLESQRFDVAGTDFARAAEEFSDAEASLREMNKLVAAAVSVIPQTDRTFETVRGLVEAGKEMSKAASVLAQAGNEISHSSSLSATEKLKLLSTYVNAAKPHVEAAHKGVEKVNPELVPADYREAVDNLATTVPALAGSLEKFSTLADALYIVMGGQQKMRYLVTFQNNTELRATGGFIGSFAEMDILHGDIEAIHIPAGGTYDLQGQLSAFVNSPKPLSLINARWEFHDANWFPDFPSSARKLLWFYDRAGGPTVDGVISINASMMPKLLEITGPIEMPEYDRTIDSENFLFETQKIVEIEYDQYRDEESTRVEDAPKQFIGDLAPKVLDHLQDADMPTMLAVMEILADGLESKDVILYFQDNALQSHMESLGWSGSMKQTDGDYLMVVNTNLGGGKTDTVIDQNISVDVHIQEDGSVVNTVKIVKQHRGLKTELFEGVNNVDYVRLYVPRGSQLLSAEGFEIPPEELFKLSELPLDEDPHLALSVTAVSQHGPSKTDVWNEDGKTVFGNWIQTAPGETETVTFTYKLPFTLANSTEDTILALAKQHLGLKSLETYTLLLQKQPGVETRSTTIRTHLPNNLQPIISVPDTTNDVFFTNDRDHFLHMLLERKR